MFMNWKMERLMFQRSSLKSNGMKRILKKRARSTNNEAGEKKREFIM